MFSRKNVKFENFYLRVQDGWVRSIYIYIRAYKYIHMGVSKNNGTPKSSSLIGFSIINHPFWGVFPLFFGNTHIYIYIFNTPDIWSSMTEAAGFPSLTGSCVSVWNGGDCRRQHCFTVLETFVFVSIANLCCQNLDDYGVFMLFHANFGFESFKQWYGLIWVSVLLLMGQIQR